LFSLSVPRHESAWRRSTAIRIGFHNLTICQYTQPPLTSIEFSPRELARLAFSALLEEIQQAPQKTSFEYKTRFVLRESTCAPRA
jgi:DNA-binding LacI/PurR family transcriptional regulator